MEAQLDKRGIPGSTLKVIAIAFMVVDHIGVVLLAPLIQGNITSDSSYDYWVLGYELLGYELLRCAGRIAFPIFCFLLVEGFLHTRSRSSYAARLLLFATLSEIPFDLAVSNQLFDLSGQNVFFTLLIGLGALAGLERYSGKALMQGLSVLAACGLAILLQTDYSAMGVLLMVLLYAFRGRNYPLLPAALLVLLSGLIYQNEYFGVLAFLPLYFYNGKRGPGGTIVKFLFYAFYPAHLFIFYLIRVFVFKL